MCGEITYHSKTLTVQLLNFGNGEIISTHHLTHWGRVMHICFVNVKTIGSDYDLSPGRRQAIIWTNARILLIRTVETNFSEILISIHTFSSKKMHLKMSSGKCRPFCFGLNVLTGSVINYPYWDCNSSILIKGYSRGRNQRLVVLWTKYSNAFRWQNADMLI